MQAPNCHSTHHTLQAVYTQTWQQSVTLGHACIACSDARAHSAHLPAASHVFSVAIEPKLPHQPPLANDCAAAIQQLCCVTKCVLIVIPPGLQTRSGLDVRQHAYRNLAPTQHPIRNCGTTPQTQHCREPSPHFSRSQRGWALTSVCERVRWC